MVSVIYSLSRVFSRQSEDDRPTTARSGTKSRSKSNSKSTGESSSKKAQKDEENDSQTQVWYHRPRSRTVKQSLNSTGTGIKNPLSTPPLRKNSSLPSLERSYNVTSKSTPIRGGFLDSSEKLSSNKARPATCCSFSRDFTGGKDKRPTVMWEDSGYNTPNSKTLDDSLDEISSPVPNSYKCSLSNKYKNHEFDLSNKFSRPSSGTDVMLTSRNSCVLSGEKFRTVRSTYTPTIRSRHSSEKAVKYCFDGSTDMPKSQASATKEQIDQELKLAVKDSLRRQSRSCSRSRGRSNNSRGMSPTFTNAMVSTTTPMMRERSKSAERNKLYSSSPFPINRNNADYHLLAESFVSGTGRERSLSRKTNPFYSFEPRKVEQLDGDGGPEFFGDYKFNNHLKNSLSTKSLLSPSNESFYLNTLEETKNMVDENVNQILADGSNEFNDKYSKWIQQVFNLQLDKIHTRLQQSFKTQLNRLIQDKDREIIEIQQVYRQKLIELEASTEKFQNWFDNLSEENEHLKQANRKMAIEMNLQSNNQERQFTTELDKQMNEFEAKSEQEKLQLHKRHAEQIQTVTNKCNEQVQNLEAQYKHQIESLEKLVEELKNQNESLSQHLKHYKKVAGDQTTDLCVKYPREREQMLSTINGLREQLAFLEREKTMVLLAHNEEIVELHKELDAHNQELSAQIKGSQIMIDNLKRQREDDMAEMRERLHAKEKEYQSTLNSLRTKYGNKISELSNTVMELQQRLMGRSRREFAD